MNSKSLAGFNLTNAPLLNALYSSPKLNSVKDESGNEENQSPQAPAAKQSPFLLHKLAVNGIVKYQKRDVTVVETTDLPNESEWNNTVKAKRLKKLASELPDIGGVEDLLKFQEELTETKQELHTVRELSDSRAKEIELLKQENARLMNENKSLDDQVNQQQLSKEIVLGELTEKTKVHESISLERDLIARQLTDYSTKLAGFEEKVQASESLKLEQQKEVDRLQGLLHEVREDKDISRGLLEKSENTIYKLKQRYFFSCALALKLNAQLSDQHYNGDLTSLYEQAIREQVPFDEWHKWLLNRMF